MIFYTADIHLGFEPMLQLEKRPYKNVLSMNYGIIASMNRRLTEEDTLYIVGDVSWYGADIDYLCYLLKQIKGKKVLIVGNHDRHLLKSKKFRKCFTEIHDHLLITDGKYDLFLAHYPHAEWDGYYKGRYHFYAHVHSKEDGGAALINLLPQAINVGYDANDCMPMTAEELITKRKSSYVLPDVSKFLDMVLNPEVDLNRSPKAAKFAEANAINRLSKMEVDVVNKIARLTKMDCWFMVVVGQWQDYIFDIEQNENISLRDGVLQLNEGVNEETIDKLEECEQHCYKRLLEKLYI